MPLPLNMSSLNVGSKSVPLEWASAVCSSEKHQLLNKLVKKVYMY